MKTKKEEKEKKRKKKENKEKEKKMRKNQRWKEIRSWEKNVTPWERKKIGEREREDFPGVPMVGAR